MPIAYLVSEYPAASHTFIRREVAAVRAHGVEIQTYSVRTPSEAERSGPPDRAAFEETYYLLPVHVSRVLRSHVGALLRHPAAYARTFALALRHRVPGIKALVWSLFHFAEAVMLARELERRGATHLHNHFANSGATVGLLASRFLGLPWSLTLHGSSETDYPAGVLLGKKLEAAVFAPCVSHYGRAQAMRTISPEHWQKLVIVRCALDLRVLPPRAARPAGSLPRVICVGRLSPEKGHIGLLEAFAKARARGLEAELVLVGDGPERERIERCIAELRLEGCVSMLGRMAEAQTLAEIAASDVLVLASLIEGLPVVLMEAMALGLPVIAPRVAGVPELVEHKLHGLLFAPAAWDELALHLYTLLADATQRDSMGRAGRVKIEAEFEISRAVVPLAARWQSNTARSVS
jgi:glycosyltransferase involved in cell wall biosynthesis